MLPLFILTIEDPQKKEVFAELYERFESFMYQVAFSVLQSSSDAEDAVHQVILKLLKNDVQLDPSDGRVKAYLGVAVKNAALNMLRHSESEVPLDGQPAEYALSDAAGFEPGPEAHDEDRDIQAAILSLPAEYKEAVLLHYYYGYKVREIAKIVGISAAAAQKRLERARQMLKEQLKEEEL